LPPTEIDTYDAHVADSKDLRRFRLDQETWKAYGELVGDGGRSADLKAYIDWRLDNPGVPLPGRRRVAPPKVRKTRTEEPPAGA
jgi:hypothetical protein